MTAIGADAVQPSAVDEQEFAALKDEIRAYIDDAGARWAERIERERAVPPELWDDLRDRGYLRLTAPVEYGGRGIPLSRYLELLELLSKSHGSLRMIVHVCNGIWRPIVAHATPEQRERFANPARRRRDQGRVRADRADRRHRRRPAHQRRARGRHLLRHRREAPDHVRDDRRLPAADRPHRGHEGRRGHARGDDRRPMARECNRA